ncbi:type VI secretion system Vgr family protein [Janthinobacterium sp.]|uniref:type VI secretion system Vgr family protein n=1 Tax=Janthinobacterium sp. TaxID=1871054 RepID=UPI00293D31C7|nr:type VI secretion system Vgr family protein [Janthinobacterium sp.]
MGRQNNRILRLSFPHDDGPACEFVVNKLEAFEGLSRDFEFTLEILSDNPSLALKDIQGKLLSVELVCGDGTLRYFSGYCFSFRLKKAENIAFYEAKLAPWFKYLSLRKDNYLFHNANLGDQTASIFADYAGHASWDLRLAGEDAAMTDACQFDESDGNYLQRRWEAAGWHYFYEHGATGHKLVLSDDTTRAAPIDGGGAIRLHRHGGALEEDGISEWSPVRRITAGNVALAAYDFKTAAPRASGMPGMHQSGKVLDIESYEYTGAYGFKTRADGERLARLRMEELEAHAKHIDASGNNRHAIPGRSFRLVERFGAGGEAGRNEYLILEVEHLATNNYLQQADEAPHYSNRLRCSRKAVPWRPGRGFNSVDTKILAPQTATVVGPQGQGSIHTDQFGRIRVQFHWDRVGVNDSASSAWLRVSSAWAGGQLGAAAIPRVGAEVIVMWLDGSPDRPIVTGAVHNARYMAPWALPSQQALTGLRSRELTPSGGNAAVGRSNHLILDDTNEQIQAQLKSDHQHSQLSLGHITRVESNAGRRDARGEGWELASDAWGVARAGKGMLITTEARPRAASHIKDMGETVARLSAARDLHEVQADMARQHGAQEKTGQQAAVADAIKAQNDAIKGAGGGTFPELSAPHLVLASPAGIEMTTAKSTHIASDQHTALTTGKSLSIASGDSLFASIRQTLRLFVHKAGMKMIAAAGDIDMQALTDSINILAKLNITQTANRITITAKEEVVINGGGSYTRYNAGGIEHGTNGSWVAHAANHNMSGPMGMPISSIVPINFSATPAAYSQQINVSKMIHNDPELIGAHYEIWTKGADARLLAQGIIDSTGKSVRIFTKSAEELEIIVGDNEWQSYIHTENNEKINQDDVVSDDVDDDTSDDEQG